MEKCSQVIHDDRRTGSRAALLVAPFGKALRHLSPSGVNSRIVVCWLSRVREPHPVLLHALCCVGHLRAL